MSDPRAAQYVLDQVIRWIESYFGRGRLGAVRFSFGSTIPVPGAIISFGQTNFAYSNGVSDLHIETAKHVPPAALGGILAHEIGHVLLFVDDKTLNPNPTWPSDDHVSEGFCEVVRSQWLESSNDPLAGVLRRSMDTDVTPVYADGFRMMLPEFQRAGSLVMLRNSLVGGGTIVGPAHSAPPTQRPIGPGNGASTHPDQIPMLPVDRTGRVPVEPPSGRPVICISSHPRSKSPGGAPPMLPARPVIPVKRIS